MTDTLRINDVRFSYDGVHQMRFDVSIASGEFVAILGASGSGKSTLLSLLAGFEEAQSGTIILAGQDVTQMPPAKRPISMVFQDNNLFAHLSVADNVGLGLAPNLKLDSAMRAKRHDALARTGLADLANRKPDQLSGGQRQRVALARALVRNRPVLLLDEAFASLGPGLRTDMLNLVKALHQEAGLVTLMVTHAPEDAALVADRVLFVDQGAIIWDAPAATAFDRHDLPPQVQHYLETSGDNSA